MLNKSKKVQVNLVPFCSYFISTKLKKILSDCYDFNYKSIVYGEQKII